MEYKYIAIMHEKGEYDDKVKYEFPTEEERYNFIKAMSGYLICLEAYHIKKH